MRNENWNDSEYTPVDPWDRGTYQTGSTTPPKNHGGLVAIVLVLAIFLMGILSILAMMRISLFQVSGQSDPDPSSYLNIQNPNDTKVPSSNATQPTVAPTVSSTEPTAETEDRCGIGMENSPAGVENIPQEGGLSLQEIYVRTIHSVVSISCGFPGGMSTGTGVILSSDGYIVTNAHVVDGAETISVILSDERVLVAALVGIDEITDLAVLRVDEYGLSPAELGDSSVLRVGDAVVAIGDPLGITLRGTMTDGIISGINRDIPVDGRR